MWSLVREDGSVFRRDFIDQWQRLKTAVDEQGRSFTKRRALATKSGTIIYKTMYHRCTEIRHPVYRNGEVGAEYKVKTSYPVKMKYLLIENND